MSIAKGQLHYSEAKKIQTVTTYLALGNAPLTEAVTGVPRGTIRKWKQMPWWKDLENEIRNEEDSEMDTKLSKIIKKSLDAVEDRLDNGEMILDSKTGKVLRIPVKLRDVHKVGVELIDKRNVIRGKPTSITQKVTMEDMMSKLADEFKKWAQLVKPDTQQVETIEGEFSAIYEEREEGLREGIRGVSLEEGTEREPLGTEQSPRGDGEASR